MLVNLLADPGVRAGLVTGLVASLELVVLMGLALRSPMRLELIALAGAGIVAIPGLTAAGWWGGVLAPSVGDVDLAAQSSHYWVAFALTFVVFAVPVVGVTLLETLKSLRAARDQSA